MGSVVERSGGALPTRVRLPSGADAGVAPGFIPRGVPGCVRACVHVQVCGVCKPRQARPRTSRQSICVERTVNVGVQLNSYMIPQCSCVF